MTVNVSTQAQGSEYFVFPCSYAQQRLWFLSRLVPDNPFYNIHAAIPLQAAMDERQLQASLDDLVARHESLRTSFEIQDGVPCQVVFENLQLELKTQDLSHLSPSARDTEVMRLAQAEARQVFDLSNAPLLSVVLLKLGPQDYVLLLTIHHIVSDAWSMGVLFRELSELYTARTTSRAPQLPELSIQYADFSVWQQEWLQGEVLEQQLDYWRERLQQLEPLQLPTDFDRPSIATYEGASWEFRLSPALSANLRQFSRSLGVTLFMTLLSAFKILLHRYSGQDQILVGAPIAGRSRPELEHLIGFFINTLVLRSDLASNPSFLDLVQQVKQITTGAFQHQDLPFEKLVEHLQPQRDLSRNPLFQVTFQVMNALSAESSDAELGNPVLKVQRGAANFDLGMDLWEQGDQICARIDYSTRLFEHATIVRMAGHFCTLLEAALNEPQRNIATLPLLTELEHRLIVEDWNRTSTRYPRDASVANLFEQAVAASPDAIALCFELETYTYDQLNTSANRLAHALRARGLQPHSTVGVCMQRCSELIISLLAILKTGCAYVALDADYPESRLQLLSQDADLAFLLVCGDDGFNLGDRLGLSTIDLANPNLQQDLEQLPCHNLDLEIAPEALAYIAYTSGSTGTPKGVCVTQRNCVRLVKGTDYIHFSPEQHFLQLAPVGFDASTLEIWGPLLNGARLTIYPPKAPSLDALASFIEREGITTLWLTAGLFHQMVEHHAEVLARVPQLLAGGDALSARDVKQILSQPGNGCLINGYGPTECTTFACTHSMCSVEDVTERVPIGRPLANTRIYILDSHLQVVPIGVPGELCIGGDGVSLGYLNNPELTKQKFIPDPFSDDPADRLYRTGDRVRYLPNGEVEFLGRIDRQLKVRGYRVEPGEIETVLESCPLVKTARVTSRSDQSGDKHLIACVEPTESKTSVADLQSFLRQQLPPYMIPSEFLLVEQIPLTPQGKIDLPALLALRQNSPADEAVETTGPESEIQEMLAEIWGQTLEKKITDIHADFFSQLGGHSLLATQVVSRIRDTLDIELPLHRFFEHPTVAGLALVVEEILLDEIEAVSTEDLQDLDRQ